MILGMPATKLVVRDADAVERFYLAIGLKLVARNLGGEQETRQKQSWVSLTGDMSSHLLVLSEFPDLPAPAPPTYPGEVWLALNVADVDAFVATVTEAGGRVIGSGVDQPEHGVRAAIVADIEGHLIEIVGPIRA